MENTVISVAQKQIVSPSLEAGLEIDGKVKKIDELWSVVSKGQVELAKNDRQFYGGNYFTAMQTRVDAVHHRGSMTTERFIQNLDDIIRSLTASASGLKKLAVVAKKPVAKKAVADDGLESGSDDDSDFMDIVRQHDQKVAQAAQVADDAEDSGDSSASASGSIDPSQALKRSSGSWVMIGSSKKSKANAKAKAKKEAQAKKSADQPPALIPTSLLPLKEQLAVLAQIQKEADQKHRKEPVKKDDSAEIQFHAKLLADLSEQPKMVFPKVWGRYPAKTFEMEVEALVPLLKEIFKELLQLVPTGEGHRSFELYLDDVLRAKVQPHQSIERALKNLSCAFRKMPNSVYTGNRQLDKMFIIKMNEMVTEMNSELTPEQVEAGIDWGVYCVADATGPNAGRVKFGRARFIRQGFRLPIKPRAEVESKPEVATYTPNMSEFPPLGAALVA